MGIPDIEDSLNRIEELLRANPPFDSTKAVPRSPPPGRVEVRDENGNPTGIHATWDVSQARAGAQNRAQSHALLPDLAQLDSMVAAFRAEMALLPNGLAFDDTLRRLAIRAFEQAPLLAPAPPSSGFSTEWRPISTLAECKSSCAILAHSTYAAIYTRDAALTTSKGGFEWWMAFDFPPPALS